MLDIEENSKYGSLPKYPRPFLLLKESIELQGCVAFGLVMQVVEYVKDKKRHHDTVCMLRSTYGTVDENSVCACSVRTRRNVCAVLERCLLLR